MSVIEIANDGHVRFVTMNRPEKLNALNDELAWGIIMAVREAAADDDVWVIGITGRGRGFCAGADLTGPRVSASPLSSLTAQLDDLGWVSRLLKDLRADCDKPVVAGINGVAAGGGLALAMAADMRVMKRSARLVAAYPRIGGSPDGGLSLTMPEAMNYELAMRFLIENRSVDGDEACRLGLVGEVVDDDLFESRFAEYCRSLTKTSPLTSRLTKRVLRQTTLPRDLDAVLRLEVQSIGRAFASGDGQEARRAFLEKREPQFTGH